MRNHIIVEKMIRYSEKVLGYCDGVDYDQFLGDSKLVEACVFNLSQMGELANEVDDDFAGKYPSVPWRQIYGLRNRIVHDYEGVNLQLVWQIIQDDLPVLIRELQGIG